MAAACLPAARRVCVGDWRAGGRARKRQARLPLPKLPARHRLTRGNGSDSYANLFVERLPCDSRTMLIGNADADQVGLKSFSPADDFRRVVPTQ